MILSAKLPMLSFSSAMSANASTMQVLDFSHRRVPSGRRFSPATLTGVSASVAPLSLRCSSSLSSSYSVDEERKFVEASKHANLIPLYECIFSDQLTPVLAYRCLVKEGDYEAPSFLFESVEPNLEFSNLGRYSVVGAQPTMEIVAKENKVTVIDNEFGHITEEIVDDPMVLEHFPFLAISHFKS